MNISNDVLGRLIEFVILDEKIEQSMFRMKSNDKLNLTEIGRSKSPKVTNFSVLPNRN